MQNLCRNEGILLGWIKFSQFLEATALPLEKSYWTGYRQGLGQLILGTSDLPQDDGSPDAKIEIRGYIAGLRGDQPDLAACWQSVREVLDLRFPRRHQVQQIAA